MEKLADSGLLAGVIDVSTTEIADEIVGGVLSAGPTRLDVFARQPLPYVGSCGALDMVNFGAWDTVPERFTGRKLLPPQPDRDADAHHGRRDAARSARSSPTSSTRWTGPVRFLIPEGGVSPIDAPGPAVPRPGGRSRAVRRASRRDFRAGADRKLDAPAAAHQRRGLRRRAGRRLARGRGAPRSAASLNAR